MRNVSKRLPVAALSGCVAMAVLAWPAIAQPAGAALDAKVEAVLTRLQALDALEIPRVKSVSPDGRRTLFALATRRQQDFDLRKALRVADRDGRVVTLQTPSVRVYTNHGDEFRWSHDGRQLFTLQRDRQSCFLVRWDAVSGRILDETDVGAMVKGRTLTDIRQWLVLPDRGQLLIGVIDAPAAATPGQSIGKSGSWVLSQARAEVSRQHEVQLAAARQGRLKLFRIRLSQGVSEEIRPGMDLPDEDDDYDGYDWTLTSDGNAVLFPLRDPAMFTARDYTRSEFYSWLIAHDDPRAAEMRSASSRLIRWDLATDRFSIAYKGGPGSIGRVTERAGRIAFLEEKPELSNWPSPGRWAELMTLDAGGQARPVAVGPQLLDWRDNDGGRPGEIIQCRTLGAKGYSVRGKVVRLSLIDKLTETISPADAAVTSCAVSGDGRTVAATIENPEQPPRLMLWHAGQHGWRSILATKAAPDLPARYRQITWRSKDGKFDISGVLVLPKNVGTQPLPLIVYLRGGWALLHGAHVGDYDPGISEAHVPAAAYAAAGYAVLFADHRGVAGLDYDMSKALLGHLGDEVTLDVEAGVDKLIADGVADPKRLVIIGHSFGSAPVAYAISHSNRYKAAIVEDGPRMFPEQWAQAAPSTKEDLLYGPEALRLTLGFDPRLRKWADPCAIRTPLLLRWQSGAPVTDGVAAVSEFTTTNRGGMAGPLSQSAVLLSCLEANHVPVEIIQDHQRHGLGSPDSVRWYTSFVLDWLAKQLERPTLQ
jgi:dienelactone hydrolase